MPSKADYLAWLETCEDHTERMTEWEQNFIISIRDQVNRGRDLSEAQVAKLETIYAKTP